MQSVLVGLQHGDEGKGKISKILGEKNDYDCYVRFNGGPNAGHTIYHNNKKIVLHQLPCGIINRKDVLISTDCVVDVDKLINEIKLLESIGFNDIIKYIHISKFCHIITKENIEQDNINNFIGTTCSGIGPTYSNKMLRIGYRIGQEKVTADSFFKNSNYYKLVEPFKFLENFNNIFFEGAQGFELDIDYGDYPYVTSSSCISQAIFKNGADMSINPIVYGICKIYDTYVGTKKFQDEKDEDLKRLQIDGEEYGATTGRKRECNWLNIKKLLIASKINKVNKIYMNKCDILERVNIYKLYDENGNLREFNNINDMKKYINVYLENYEIIFSGSKNSL